MAKKIYTGVISQMEIDQPIEIIIHQNTLGAIPTWTRTSEGNFRCFAAGKFPQVKTQVWVPQFGNIGGDDIRIQGTPETDDSFNITTMNGMSSPADGVLWRTPFRVEVYP